MSVCLGLDISTTGAKALLVDEQGVVRASATSEYPLNTPRPLWSEQDPEDWWAGAVGSIRAALAAAGLGGEAVRGVGLTGQMHGLVLLDAAGQVLRPAILWNDQRTGAQCAEIERRVGPERLLRLTGNRALAGFTAPKVLWVRENEPAAYARAAHILLPKDYVRYQLTGGYATDKADGAGTLLLDLERRAWSEEVLEALGIPREWLPPLFEGPEATGQVTPGAAAATGLAAGTPVVAGAGDQAAQAVGVGAVRPGIIALTVGTSGVVFAPTDQPLVEPQGRLHAFCHAVPGKWHLMGVMLSAAGSLRWYRDTLAPGTSFEVLLRPAAEVPPGAEGLFFLPYLSGERTPHPDPLARAGLIGLTLRHSRAHITRAVLEGVAFGLRDSMELVRQAWPGQVEQVRLSGGGVSSALWRQILSDVLQRELATVNVTEGAAYGAALLAGVGTGAWSSVAEACAAAVRVVDVTTPGAEAVSAYERLYPLYQALYPALRPTFTAVGTL